jgi:hypothetical protein
MKNGNRDMENSEKLKDKSEKVEQWNSGTVKR